MIVERKERKVQAGGGGKRPPGDAGGNRSRWWQGLPPPLGRPQPMNRRTWILGALVAVPALLLIDGLLGGMAWYASGRLWVGLAVLLFMFGMSGLELWVVGAAAQRKQLEEARRAREYYREG